VKICFIISTCVLVGLTLSDHIRQVTALLFTRDNYYMLQI